MELDSKHVRGGMNSAMEYEAPRIKPFKRGHVVMEKLWPSGMWQVKCYIGTELHDKVRCDTRAAASEYFRAFCKIAKNGGSA